MVKRDRKPKKYIIESPTEIQPKIKLQRNLIKVEDNETEQVIDIIENVDVPIENIKETTEIQDKLRSFFNT